MGGSAAPVMLPPFPTRVRTVKTTEQNATLNKAGFSVTLLSENET
jgi:hypothetical protein